MRILTKEELRNERIKLVKELSECLFIHPTDTVYGLGCNATDRKLVRQLRTAKEQFSRPMSVIAPGMEWIRKNCVVDDNSEEWLDKLPGPYTLILRLKNSEAVSRATNLGLRTIGVRIPDHWFSSVVQDMEVPIITTSANITGTNITTTIDDLDDKIEKSVDYAIQDGKIEGKSSKIIKLTEEEPEILRD